MDIKKEGRQVAGAAYYGRQIAKIRPYKFPVGYPKWEHLCDLNLPYLCQIAANDAVDSANAGLRHYLQAFLNDRPVYIIKEDLLADLVQTDTQSIFSSITSDFDPPLPGFMLVYPADSWVIDTPEGAFYAISSSLQAKVRSCGDGECVVNIDCATYLSSCADPENRVVSYAHMVLGSNGITLAEASVIAPDGDPCFVALQVLLMLMYVPDRITTPVEPAPYKKQDGTPLISIGQARRDRHPRVVGSDYISIPHRKYAIGDAPKPIHRSPCTHWRRGHWRRLSLPDSPPRVTYVRPTLVKPLQTLSSDAANEVPQC
jgi:hypothetical protein